MAKSIRSDKPKYGNKKRVINGVKFDSELELYCYNLLNMLGFSFEFQKTIILQERFRHKGKWIRPITIIVDFVVDHNELKIYIDSKGMATEVSKLKYKMLKYALKEEENSDVVWLHSKKEANQFLLKLKEEKNDDKQSGIAW